MPNAEINPDYKDRAEAFSKALEALQKEHQVEIFSQLVKSSTALTAIIAIRDTKVPSGIIAPSSGIVTDMSEVPLQEHPAHVIPKK